MGLAILALVLLLASCSQPPEPGRKAENAVPSPATGESAPAGDSKPVLLETAAFGPDTRYVIAYQGNEFHVISGDEGLLAVKVPAPEETTAWESLWITFSPPQERPRKHEPQSLTEPGVPLPFVPDSIAPIVASARRMASLVAPGKPVLGDEPLSKGPRGALKGLKLSRASANELSLLARSAKLSVMQYLPVNIENIPEDIKEARSIRLDRLSQKVGYTPAGSWYAFDLYIRGENAFYLVLVPAQGRPLVLSQFLTRGVDERESLYRFRDGKLSATYFSERTSVRGDFITDTQRRDYATTLRFLDEGVISPPEPMAEALKVFLLYVQDKEKLDSFSSDLSPKYRTLEDVLKAFEAGLPF